MDAKTRRRFDELWAERLGCEPALLATPGVHLVRSRPDRSGVFLLLRGNSLIITGNDDGVRALADRIGCDPRLPTEALLRELFGTRIAWTDGPVLVAARGGAPEIPAGAGTPRLLGAGDYAALRKLRDAALPAEWKRSGLGHDPRATAIAGVFDGNRLVAASGFETILGRAAHLRVFTHPMARRRGAGRRAVATAAQAAAVRGLLLQYDALASDVASLRVAEALGFASAAECLTVQLRQHRLAAGWRLHHA